MVKRQLKEVLTKLIGSHQLRGQQNALVATCRQCSFSKNSE